MRYSDTSIQLLIGLIGWGAAVEPSNIEVAPDNSESETGLYFNSFHQLATVENVFDCISNLDVDNDGLNEFLEKMKKDAVLRVLNKIIDTNSLANVKSNEDRISLNYADDYDALIAANANVFVNAIGYAGVIKCMELFITSLRSNVTLRVLKANYEFLKTELSGIKNEQGVLLANGIEQNYGVAIH